MSLEGTSTAGYVQVTKLGADGAKLPQKLDITQEVDEPRLESIEVVSTDGSDSEVSLSGDESDSSNDDWEAEDSEEQDYEEESEDEGEEDENEDLTSQEEPVEDGNTHFIGGGHKSGSDSDTESTSSVSTTELLGRDPLFLVLSEFLMDEEGNNIVHVMQKINKNLSKIAKALEKRQKSQKTLKAHKKDGELTKSRTKS